MKAENFGDNIGNYPGCVIIRGIGGAELSTVLGLLPIGLKPDEILTENPPKTSRAWSQFILVFWKDPGAVADTRGKARGGPPDKKGDGKIGE